MYGKVNARRNAAAVGKDGASVSGQSAVTGHRRADKAIERLAAQSPAVWTSAYRRQVIAADALCALAGGMLALKLRFDGGSNPPSRYLVLSLSLPVIWLCIVALTGGYDSRFIGVGTDEFRRVLNAGVTLTAAVAILAYATKTDIARSYVVIALPCLTLFDLLARFALRKRLHRLRRAGSCMRRVVAVGHARVVADLAIELRRETYHGLSVVAACVAGPDGSNDVDGIPVVGGLRNVATAVKLYEADTVAVLACPEMSGVRLRELAWELEKTGTDLCVAPALLDVAGPRTTIRPVAGLPLLHVDHPEFTGAKQVIKDAFDKALGMSALALMAPVFFAVAIAIRLTDGGPALFRQTRVGKDGHAFTVYKFRTMVLDAEERKAQLAASNEKDGVLFKIRNDPRITTVGAWLRRWSVDELPQLINVVRGDMSLVGPRPALPDEAARYGDYVRRRLVVKPGITGLWQVNGRSDLSWEESVRLDLRYVENWSLVLDLQILWKTCSAVLRGSGAY
jgi:exopolysaccharide biosynthesis polyprenyl glycosylphosphotransferase